MNDGVLRDYVGSNPACTVFIGVQWTSGQSRQNNNQMCSVLNKFEKTETVLFKEFSLKKIGITGFSIFGGGIGDSFYIIIIILLILVGVYLIYIVYKKVRLGLWKREINAVRIFDFIKQSKAALKNNNLDDAREKYHKIQQIYPLVSGGCKRYVYKEKPVASF